jgi:hypothetical protein
VTTVVATGVSVVLALSGITGASALMPFLVPLVVLSCLAVVRRRRFDVRPFRTGPEFWSLPGDGAGEDPS